MPLFTSLVKLTLKKLILRKSIGEVIQFIAVNELPLRGQHHGGRDEEGLLIRLFDYSLQKDPKLAEFAKSIPEKRKKKLCCLC